MSLQRGAELKANGHEKTECVRMHVPHTYADHRVEIVISGSTGVVLREALDTGTPDELKWLIGDHLWEGSTIYVEELGGDYLVSIEITPQKGSDIVNLWYFLDQSTSTA